MVPGDRPEPALGKIRGNTLALAAAGPQRKKTSRRCGTSFLDPYRKAYAFRREARLLPYQQMMAT